jgi:A/G-specific adenine glycosylase
VAEFAGRIPEDPDLLATLPGIGRYTLGAILSQAFDQRLPILEANSQRVLSRLFSRRDDPRQGAARRWLWQAAEELLPARHAGEFNQALMELGALVCTPSAPQCSACPLARWCEARRLGLQQEMPQYAPPKVVVSCEEAAVVVHRDSSLLLVHRPERGRWAGMWEVPHGALQQGESHEAAAARLVAELTGIDVEVGVELLTLRHTVTHHRIRVVCFEAEYKGGAFQSGFYQEGRWIEPEALDGFPVSAPQRRLMQTLVQPERQRKLF